ncbi:ornithine carbamoyltransferase [Helicobacter sp. MIT 14-3879]|uniref:ornithine carbamoyltransferase n=1 Tax=Helicobacter sp. MIT 14-3879 TaxID=2040649 RepID=UPI000E1E91C8|nr:ornithine carbamoyltransferase [Helicobacter sp. MIT 14-3879]RDU65247.1 ornithine carbamoyltransferase [Helicobacter sp. MIT 14-3879]
MKHFLSLKDYTREEILDILKLSIEIKNSFLNGQKIIPNFKDKILAMIFEKSSTRTRISFEAGAYQLGGSSIFLSSKDIQLGRGESIKDTARVISSMVDMIMIRTFEQKRIEEFAEYSSVPVINALSDEFHPTQLIADYLTMIENGISMDISANYSQHKIVRKPIVCYIGDGNNMANSWLFLASKLGFELRIATPKGFEPISEFVNIATKETNAKINITNNPKEAINNANVVTTDTWVSMGQEEDKNIKIKAFKGFCVNNDLMRLASKNAIFLHCLPAYRGYEVSDDVIEGSQSKVFQEAQNRLHAQKGIMSFLGEKNWKK